MLKKIISCVIMLGSALFYAQNPIVPIGSYMSDPAAHVWNGKLYMYGSRDESPDYYCSTHHDVLYSDDVQHWKMKKNIFIASKNLIKDRLLYAPDVQSKNGHYYMYFCTSGGGNNEGVAVAENPLGPFKDPKWLDLNGLNQIDPSAFIDDDGQAYYTWGQFQAKIAKLKPSMLEIDKSTIKNGVITQKEDFFHEGSAMIKRNGIYYFIYADMQRAGKPTCIGYATSKSPTGPFKYGGVIIDNDHCDPGVWNNHGSLLKYKNQWYVFYHRSTQGSNTMRKACVEPITFNEDGSIDEVEMTSQGAGPPLNAFEKIDAERACLMYGNVRIQPFAPKNEALMKIESGDKAAFKYINFGKGASEIELRVAPGMQKSTIDIGLDDSWGGAMGTVHIPKKNEKKWITVTAKIDASITGVHAIWLRFSGKGKDLGAVDWLKFIK